MQTERKLELVSLSALTGADRNPKRHATEQLSTSIDRFGYVEPVVLDERTNRLVAGHGRVEALRVARHKGQAPPDGVVEVQGEWHVPVLRGWRSRSDAEASAYLLASNRLSEVGGWDESELAKLVSELGEQDALEGVGFSDEQVRELLDSVGATPGNAEDNEPPGEDELDGLVGSFGVERGQLWRLGEHRLLCGDSTSEADASRCLAGDVPLLMVTDPPYGIEYDPTWSDGGEAMRSARSNKIHRKLAGDDRADWSEAWKLFPGSVAYVWCANIKSHVVAQSLVSSLFEIRSLLVWAKSSLVLTRGHYHWQTETCWYASRGNESSRWCGGRKQSTLWEIDKPQSSETGHCTQKPVECMARPIRNHDSELVYEPFSGSGTTLVACEQLGRKCRAIEIEPRYVAATLKRFVDMTGEKPVLEK